jgi:alkanesulfonate monooxygenase SsuD/methylene tetrahydromethanopterin reductase-like flavin-dependent oxidoreductase (luciferase family)
MRYGLDISSAGSWGDPRTMAEMAALAETSGWDGVFLEDYVFFPGGLESFDPWVTLAAIAVATDTVRLGTLVTPLPLRQPARVAVEAMTLDHLSGGRLILGVGAGDPASDDVRARGDALSARSAAEILDEAIEVITALWSGKETTFHGSHLDLSDATLRPRPLQRPGIPIWVGGCLTRRGPRERALRWDGACLYGTPPPTWRDVTADDVRALRHDARERRGDDTFVVAVGGRERRDDLDAEIDYVTSLAEAGTDWWHEYVPPRLPYDTARALVEAGPIRARPS